MVESQAGQNVAGQTAHSHNLLVVSDLHIGQGIEPGDGKLNRNEDFLYGEDFAHFLVYHQWQRQAAKTGTAEARPWRLIINGDVVDFLQVTSIPALNVEALTEKVNVLLDPVAYPGMSFPRNCVLIMDDEVTTLNNFFECLTRERKALVQIQIRLQGALSNNAPGGGERLDIMGLLAETEVLLAQGDQRLDTSKLTDLEEYLRLAGELDCMTEILVSKKQAGQLAEGAYNEWGRKILKAWDHLKKGKFGPKLWTLLKELKCSKVLQPTAETLCESPPWYPPNLKGSAFQRYQDVLAQFGIQAASLGNSITLLEGLGDLQEELNGLAEDTGTKLQQAFSRLFRRVPDWQVGREDPYCLSYEDVRWGLGSSEVANVWRMYQIYAGHPVFFQGLAWFLAAGNEIIIQTGNHDIEFFWNKVRHAFREAVNLAYESLNEPEWEQLFRTFQDAGLPANPRCPNFPALIGLNSDSNKTNNGQSPSLVFTHWIYYEPGVAYIEHGCQYETANSWPAYLHPQHVGTVPDHFIRPTQIVQAPAPPDDNTEQAEVDCDDNTKQVEVDCADHSRLFWPWGSLIVRYIFNGIEQTHPFADEIKPITRYFVWAFTRDLFRTIALFFLSIPGIIRVTGQLLERGVIEGWFGATRSISGVLNVLLRGGVVYFTWMQRLVRFDWLASWQDEYVKLLRWPVLPWNGWAHMVDRHRKKRIRLSTRLPGMSGDIYSVENQVLSSDQTNEPATEGSPESQPTDEEATEGPPEPQFTIRHRLKSACRDVVVQAFLVGLISCLSLLVGWKLYTYFTDPGLLSGINWVGTLGLIALLLFVHVLPPRQQIEASWLGIARTYSGLLFIVVATIGLIALVAWLLVMAGVDGRQASRASLFLSLVLAVAILVYYCHRLWRFRKVSERNKWSLLTAVIVALFAALVWVIITLWKGFNWFPDYSQWTWLPWLPLAAIWGFLGLWLLESKESPFPQQQFQGWLGDRVGANWGWLQGWLQPVLYNTFSLLAELGLVVLALGAWAQWEWFNSRPLSAFLRNFGGSRETVVQVLATAAILLLVGMAGRSILGWLQTEDLARRLHHWQRKNIWQLQLAFGLGFLGLIAVAGGRLPDAVNEWLLLPQCAVRVIVVAAAIFLILRIWVSWGTILLFSGSVALVTLWIAEVRLLGGQAAGIPVNVFWLAALLLIVAGLIFWSRQEDQPMARPSRELVTATWWGLLLLVGILVTAVVVPFGIDKKFEPLIKLAADPEERPSDLQLAVDVARFELRLERALRLSYTTYQYGTDPEVYLKRLRQTDPELAAVFEAVYLSANTPKEDHDRWIKLVIPDSFRYLKEEQCDAEQSPWKDKIEAVWNGRLVTPSDQEGFLKTLNDREECVDTALKEVIDKVRKVDFDLWERAILVITLRLWDSDLRLLEEQVDPIRSEDGALVEAHLAQISNLRADQGKGLQSIYWVSNQHDILKFGRGLAMLAIVTLLLIGMGGMLFLSFLNSVVGMAWNGDELSADQQVDRIECLAHRQQSNLVRRVARIAIVFLAIAFGVGLIAGFVLVINGLFAKSWETTLNSVILILTSEIGRRLLSLIPAGTGHSDGYLVESAAEISQILERGGPTDLQPVPYLLFGHSHIPGYLELPSGEPQHRRWYVNTGAWTQAYTGEVRFWREDEDHSVFVKIIPGPETTGLGREPMLLRWDGKAGRPARLNHLISAPTESLAKQVVKITLRWLGLKEYFTFPQN